MKQWPVKALFGKLLKVNHIFIMKRRIILCAAVLMAAMANTFACTNLIAVSYTHLDVYKRQDQRFIIFTGYNDSGDCTISSAGKGQRICKEAYKNAQVFFSH